MRNPMAWLWTLAGCALSVFGCSILLKTNEQPCETDADCEARGPDFAGAVCVDRLCQPPAEPQGGGGAGGGAGGQGGAPDPRWTCLGEVQWPEPVPGDTVSYSMQVIELNTQEPPADLQVLVCNALDIECVAPVAGPLVVDGDGWMTVELDNGFTGYFDVTSPSTMPAMLFQTKPITEDVSDPLPIQILTPQTLNLLALVGGYEVNEERGHALVLTSDCNGDIAAGVQLSTDSEDPEIEGFYLINEYPSLTATATDQSGNGGFINLPPGWVSVISTVEATSEHIGSTRFTVRAGTIAYLSAMPTPDE